MNGCLNILWHIPFLGFLLALIYGLFGLVLCCTVILYPIGLGFFQIAAFLLSPFSSALVSKSDLELVRPSEKNEAAQVYSTIIMIVYIPFGIIAAVGTLFAAISFCLSIIGIPCGIVYFKLLPSIFNPINKVCVPAAVAQEIERVKAGVIVGKYKGETTAPSQNPVISSSPEPQQTPVKQNEDYEIILPPQPEVRKYSDDELKEIVESPEMYRPDLVEKCLHEMEIRSKATSFVDKVHGFDDAKLNEVLRSPQLYSEEVCYACLCEVKVRAAKKMEEEQLRIQTELAEKERLEKAMKEEKERQKEHRKTIWMKYRFFVIAGIIVIIAGVAGICYYGYSQEQKRLEQERFEAELAFNAEIKRLETERIASEKRLEAMKLEQEKKEAEKRVATQKAETERREQERIAAEQEALRVAAEKQAEEERLAAERRVKEDKLAVIKKEKEEKEAAEKAAAEKMRIKHESGNYEVGDVLYDRTYRGKKAVIYNVTDKYVEYLFDMSYYKYNEARKAGLLTSPMILDKIRQNKAVIDKTLKELGYGSLAYEYWTNETDPKKLVTADAYGAYNMSNGKINWHKANQSIRCLSVGKMIRK